VPFSSLQQSLLIRPLLPTCFEKTLRLVCSLTSCPRQKGGCEAIRQSCSLGTAAGAELPGAAATPAVSTSTVIVAATTAVATSAAPSLPLLWRGSQSHLLRSRAPANCFRFCSCFCFVLLHDGATNSDDTSNFGSCLSLWLWLWLWLRP